jgi:DNA-binding protein HU-beta
MVVSRADLVEKVKAAVKEKDVISNAATERYVNAVFDTIKAEVAAGNEVIIKNFGTFKTVNRAERTARNPRTGETITVPATKTPKFTAGAGFKAAVK